MAVIGAEVARALAYGVGTHIVNAHGAGEIETHVHDDVLFEISGVLGRSGTPVDRMVFVSLEGFATLHETDDSATLDPLARLNTDTQQDDHRDRVDVAAYSEQLHKTEAHSDAEDEDLHDHADAEHNDATDDEEHKDHDHSPETGDPNTIFIGLVAPEAALHVLIFLLGYGLFDQFVGNILQPAMQGRSLNVRTFMVMVSLAFWGSI